jgi:integrase
MDWYVKFARDVRGLERTTVFGYQEVFDVWLRPRIGHVLAERLTPAQIDEAFGRMRAQGKSHSRMNNARSALSGAYKWGRRHEMVRANPMRGFEIPKSTHVPRKTVAPEADELRLLLSQAQAFDPEFAQVLILAATTGMRRGELSGLRRDRLLLARGELCVERSISEIEGVLEDKPTKNSQSRIIKLDPATLTFLRAHLARMDERAGSCDLTVADDGFVFSLDPECATPMRPELMTRRMRRIRKHLGITKSDFDANILAMRKWTSTELMDAGFNPSAVSGRQGHTVQVMLNNYSSWRSSADQAAADHLGAQVFGPETND